ADDQGNPRYEDALKVAVNRHDLSVIKVHDPREQSIPDLGLVNIHDLETGAGTWVNTSSKHMRAAYEAWYRAVADKEKKMFNRYKVDSVDIATNEDYVKGLMTLFSKK
ncbi:MAG: DUF58 domain-containing protein, partial [Bacteroidales bacterium]|nr:DUF58 domain-containing protein [Bacteroidales bacterium]